MQFAWMMGIIVSLALMWGTAVQAVSQSKHLKSARVIKLKPQIREVALSETAPSIELSQIAPFLRRSLVLDKQQQFEKMPYVLSEVEGYTFAGPGSKLYVRGIKDNEESLYDIYTKVGRTYVHPKTRETLGFEAFAIGIAALETLGDPATVEVKEAQEVIEHGARLAPSFAAELPVNLTLKPAKTTEEGYILSAKDMAINSGMGSGNVVTISMGRREGLEEGNTLEIYRPGKVLADPMGKKGWRAESVALPDRHIGQLLVFQTYEKLSLALILHSTESISLLDKVQRPTSTR